MTLRAALACLATLASILSGCAGPADEAPRQATDVPTITDPRDTAYLANATPGSHVHDYWGGRERVPVLDVEGEVWSSCSGGCGDGMAGANARPDEGVIVPQGARWVNGTFAFTPGAEHTAKKLELWVKTAADGDTKKVKDLTPGEPFSIEVAQEQDDPPHYVLSLWRFEVVAKGGPSEVTFRGEYSWDVEAVRGWPLVPYPPHPDRWGGADELPILAETRSATLAYQTDTTFSCYGGAVGGCPGRHTVPDGVVIPHDADHVTARITTNLPVLGLAYHGADTWAMQRVEGRLEGAEQVFDIPLSGTLGDSPYASQSLWEFRVLLEAPQPNAAAWAGTYTLTVTAHKSA